MRRSKGMVIGITGGVGCGKSTVLKLLEQNHGAKILMADRLGHEAMTPGSEPYQKICRQFGKEILHADGTIDRAALSVLVYKDPEKLQCLNGIIHPFVLSQIQKRLAEWRKEPLIVLETAILFETGCDVFCDAVWGIVTDREVRMKRLAQSRGYTRQKTESIMAQQMPEEELYRRCDRIIHNSGTGEQLEKQLQERLQEQLRQER